MKAKTLLIGEIDRILAEFEQHPTVCGDIKCAVGGHQPSRVAAQSKIEAYAEDRVVAARMDEHEILMANIGAEYASAIHGLGEKKDYDPELIEKAFKDRLKQLNSKEIK